MTPTRDRILDYVSGYIDAHGYGPSIREIADGCELSSSNVAHYNLRKLRDAGRVTWVEGQARTLRVVREVVE